MRHALPPRLAHRRAALRKGLGPHPTRTPVLGRAPHVEGQARVSDIILGVLGVTLLGAIALVACFALASRTLAP